MTDRDLDLSPARLRAAAKNVDADAAALRCHDPSTALGRVETALPGGTSMVGASCARDSLSRDLRGLAGALDTHADALRTAATTFRAEDYRNSCLMGEAGQPLGTPHPWVPGIALIEVPWDPRTWTSRGPAPSYAPAPQPGPARSGLNL